MIDHLTGQPTGENRNVLVESARIARGRIAPLAALDIGQVDAVVFPGGFGAAKNLCTFAVSGPDCSVDPQVERVIRSAHQAGKPIGAWCIAPALLARVLGAGEVTIGTDAGTAAAIGAMGATHHEAMQGMVVVDQANRLVTTPCYMLESSIGQIADGVDAGIAAVLKLIG